MSQYDSDLEALTELLADQIDAPLAGPNTRRLARRTLSGIGSRVVREMAVRYLAGAAVDLLRQRTAAAERRAEEETNSRRFAYWNSPEGKARAAREDRQREEEYDRKRSEIRQRVRDAIDEFKTELRMEWTAELLESTFVTREGTRVSWGDATIEQHAERAEMFEGNAIANAQGAARHRYAYDALENSGAKCLRDLVG